MILVIVFNFTNNKNSKSNLEGTVLIIVKDIDGEINSKKRYEYNKGDSLFDILNDNYKLEYETSAYGHYLYSIDDVETDKFNTFLWLEIAYLNEGEEYSDYIDFSKYSCSDSSVGIDSIELKDNMILGICKRDSKHKTSIFSDSINVGEKTSNYKIFKIVVYIMLVVLITSLIIYGIIKNKISNEKLGIRRMCILSLMAVILFVQEEALTILPNIQLTFLLISVYAAVFGVKYSLLVVAIHVILDNIVMGSFTPLVMIPMFIGYIILVIVMNLLRNEKLIFKVIGASICSWIYCMVFLIANALFLDINVKEYFIADIPFEILLILSTIFTLTYLYNPIYKVLYREWNKNEVKDILIEENDSEK